MHFIFRIFQSRCISKASSLCSQLGPWVLPDRESVLQDFYGTCKQDILQGRMVQADALYDTQFSTLLLEFRNFKSYISQQKNRFVPITLGKKNL